MVQSTRCTRVRGGPRVVLTRQPTEVGAVIHGPRFGVLLPVGYHLASYFLYSAIGGALLGPLQFQLA